MQTGFLLFQQLFVVFSLSLVAIAALCERGLQLLADARGYRLHTPESDRAELPHFVIHNLPWARLPVSTPRKVGRSQTRLNF